MPSVGGGMVAEGLGAGAGRCPRAASGGAASQHCLFEAFSSVQVQHVSHGSVLQSCASPWSLIE